MELKTRFKVGDWVKDTWTPFMPQVGKITDAYIRKDGQLVYIIDKTECLQSNLPDSKATVEEALYGDSRRDRAINRMIVLATMLADLPVFVAYTTFLEAKYGVERRFWRFDKDLWRLAWIWYLAQEYHGELEGGWEHGMFE